MSNLIPAIAFAVLIVGCAAPAPENTDVRAAAATGQACADVGGSFLVAFNECEDVSQASCTAMGGSFDECASACRHLPEAVMCTSVCVPVCSFGDADATRQPQSVFVQTSLECNLMDEPRKIGGVIATYSCQAPGAYLTFVDTRGDPWTAGYFTTDSQSTEVTYGPERVTVVPNPNKQ